MTPGSVSASVSRSLLWHIDLNQISYQCSIYILTHCHVQLHHYAIHLQWSVSIHAITSYSIFQLLDKFHSQGCLSVTPIVKNNITDRNEKPACQFYLQLFTVPSTIASRGQSHLASTPPSTENLHSSLCWVTPILTQHVPIIQAVDTYDASDLHYAENTADRDDDLSDSLGHYLGDSLGNDLSEQEPTMQFEIRAMQNISEHQRETEMHMVDWEQCKYQQVPRAPIVEVYMIAIPLQALIWRQNAQKIRRRYRRQQCYLPR